jgi:hypothetical protein
LKAEPRSGPGRLPKAPRVCVCETQPRAPHPTGLGYPAPAKLSLCPTSVTPLEEPLIGQASNIYRFVGITSIGIFGFRKNILRSEIRGNCVAYEKPGFALRLRRSSTSHPRQPAGGRLPFPHSAQIQPQGHNPNYRDFKHPKQLPSVSARVSTPRFSSR